MKLAVKDSQSYNKKILTKIFKLIQSKIKLFNEANSWVNKISALLNHVPSLIDDVTCPRVKILIKIKQEEVMAGSETVSSKYYDFISLV